MKVHPETLGQLVVEVRALREQQTKVVGELCRSVDAMLIVVDALLHEGRQEREQKKRTRTRGKRS